MFLKGKRCLKTLQYLKKDVYKHLHYTANCRNVKTSAADVMRMILLQKAKLLK